MNIFQNVLRDSYQASMGIIRDTIKTDNDVRIERLPFIETLKDSKPGKVQKSSKAGAILIGLFNRSLALIFLLVTSPILLIVSIWIKLDSPGPIFFRQERMGKCGRIFKIVKFRTMVSDAEKYTGPVLASKDDHRITKAGRILRHLRIDEFPQMYNVLIGNMSLVGPRPERPEIYDGIIQNRPEFFSRLDVKPGITGLAQIRGNYHTDPRDKLRYDLLYIKRRSIWLDLRIIAITAYICLLRKGAC